MTNDIQYKEITYTKLLELHGLGLLSEISSVEIYPAQIEFEFDEQFSEHNSEVLNQWFIDFFINLSNDVMEKPCMTSCSMNFYVSENKDLSCRIEAVISSSSDLFVGFNEHDEEDEFNEEIEFDGEEEWVETINMATYFNNLN